MEIIITFLCGMVFWTFMEYMLHRFFGHEFKFRNKFRKEHQTHHHKRNYFTSNFDKVLSSIIFGGLTLIITYYSLGKVLSISFTSGFILMYLIYEYIHRTLHVQAPRNSYGRLLRRHHFYHHFKDEMMNHGVTTPFWDIVFRTYVKAQRVPINKKFKMDWLCEGDIVREQYRSEYDLVERTRFT